MRKDHYTAPVKWTREFRQALKLSDAHFKVYAYLEGGPESHATGLFFILVSAIAEMVREDRETVASVLEDLEQVGLILWDRSADVVLVHAVCAEQYRFPWKKAGPENLRIIEARRHLHALPATPLRELFLGRWPVFHDAAEGASVGASVGATQGASVGASVGDNTSTRSYYPPDPPNGRPTDPGADPDKTDGQLSPSADKRRGGVVA